MVRQASVERKTGETQIAVTLNLDVAPGEKQAINVSTGVGFLDHVSVLVRKDVAPRVHGWAGLARSVALLCTDSDFLPLRSRTKASALVDIS